MRLAGQTGIWLRRIDLRVRQVCGTSGLAWRSSKLICSSPHKIDSCPRTLPFFVFAYSVLFPPPFPILFSLSSLLYKFFLPSIFSFFIILLFPLFLSSFHIYFPSFFYFHLFFSFSCSDSVISSFSIIFSVSYLPPPYFSVVSLLPLKFAPVL